MPELISSRLLSPWGSSGALLWRKCPFSSKKFKKHSLNSFNPNFSTVFPPIIFKNSPLLPYGRCRGALTIRYPSFYPLAQLMSMLSSKTYLQGQSSQSPAGFNSRARKRTGDRGRSPLHGLWKIVDGSGIYDLCGRILGLHDYFFFRLAICSFTCRSIS